MNSKLKDIEDFLDRESSVLERGKRYKDDVGFLLGMIYDLRLHIANMKPMKTSDISIEMSLKLLQEILALVDEYNKRPRACG